MKTAHLQPADRPTTAADVPMQPASWDIWDTKYRLKAKDGTIVDVTVDDTSGVGVTERDTCSDADVANPEWIQGTLPPERLGERFPHEPHDDAATAVGCERRRVDGHDSR